MQFKIYIYFQFKFKTNIILKSVLYIAYNKIYRHGSQINMQIINVFCTFYLPIKITIRYLTLACQFLRILIDAKSENKMYISTYLYWFENLTSIIRSTVISMTFVLMNVSTRYLIRLEKIQTTTMFTK